jgi:hypothetical protein
VRARLCQACVPRWLVTRWYSAQRYTIQKRERSRHWMVIDPQGELVCLTVYNRGVVEVVWRLTA